MIDILGKKNKNTLGSWQVGKSDPERENNNKIFKNTEILKKLYEAIKYLSEKEQIYILNTIKFLNRLLNENDNQKCSS